MSSSVRKVRKKRTTLLSFVFQVRISGPSLIVALKSGIGSSNIMPDNIHELCPLTAAADDGRILRTSVTSKIQ